jgi:MerR family transcriptional regulator/heat shock protein HspR
MIDDRTPVYMISIVAKLLGVHPQTLRFYENEGLLKPSRTSGKTRLYSERDLRRARRIVSLTRKRGVNIAGVELILSLEEELENFFEQLSRQLSEEIKREIISILNDLECQELNVKKLMEILEK